MEKSTRYKTIQNIIEKGMFPKYRLQQIMENMYKGKILKINDMRNIPTLIRRELRKTLQDNILSIVPISEQKYDRAYKVLFECVKDKERFETTCLDFGTHKSLCISSQIGCAFSCKFCATGQIGMKRQLDLDELTDQLLYFQSKKVNVKNVSFMGMGEPLSNPRVFDSIPIFTSSEFFSISSRRINISTVGVLPALKKLNELYPQVNVSFSLHSPFSEERNQLVPINRFFPFQEVFTLLDERIRNTRRRVWISYVLLENVNDSQDHAEALCEHICNRGKDIRYLYNVCLIPYNQAKNVNEGFHRVNNENKIHSFEKVLRKHGISFFYRNSFGYSIEAACGQLYAGYEPKTKTTNVGIESMTLLQ